MRSYVAREANKLDDDEYYMRQLARHYVLIAANAGLRTGEQQQLRWCDVKMKKHDLGAAMQTKLLAEIYVRKETSKVRKDRKLYCRGGTYFERWKELSKHTSSTDLIFSLDGKTRISNRAITVRYGSKPIELSKGKNAIQCTNASEVGTVLSTVKEAVLNGELDTALSSVTGVGSEAK